MATVSLFNNATTTLASDGAVQTQGINLGTVFKCNVAGNITHLRYYETPNMAGTVTLRLYDTAAAVLASTTHTAVAAASGWREVALGTPYAITVGTWMEASYHVPARNTFDNLYSTL